MTDFVMIFLLLGTAVAGFCLGRIGMHVVHDEPEEAEAPKCLELIRGGYSVASPVTGRVVSACSRNNWEIISEEDGNLRDGMHKQENGVLIEPSVGKVYAPASGKIIRQYPMGNAMVLRTDAGWELMIMVGCDNNEMNSMYYRARVVKNEIVSKGKLLLEYDISGLQSEGADTSVRMGIVNYREAEIAVCGRGAVKVGEELMRVRHHAYNSQLAPDSFIKSL